MILLLKNVTISSPDSCHKGVIKVYPSFDRADTPLPPAEIRADSSSTPHTSEVVCRWVFSLYICLGEML